MPPTLVILGQVADWLAIPKLLRDSAVVWLATTPGAIRVLHETEQPVLIPEDLVPAVEVEQMCIPAYESLRGLCLRLDELLPAGLGVFSLALWDLGAWLDGVLWRATVLERLHTRWPDARVVCWPAGRSGRSARTFELTWSGCRWSAVLSRMPWMVPGIDYQRPTSTSHIAERVVALWLRRNPLVWSAMQLHRQGLGIGAIARLAGDSPGWLMFKAPYDWGDTLRQLTTAGNRVIFDEPERYYAGSSGARNMSSGDRQILDRLWSEFLDCLPIWMHGALEPVAAELLRLGVTAPTVMRDVREVVARTTDRFKLHGVMNAIGPNLRVQAVLAAFRSQGVPVMKWQHGAVWWNRRVTQRMDDADMGATDLLLTYGPGAADAYRSAGRHRCCRVAEVGSPRLDAIRARASARSSSQPPRRLLYVTTDYYGDGWYCGFSPPFADTLYYRSQAVIARGLAALLDEVPELQLTVKLPQRYVDAAAPWCAGLVQRRNCRVVAVGTSFSELALQHDAILVDSPTTTLLESVSTNAAVFVLLGTIGWPEAAVAKLTRRAVCRTDAAELSREVAQFVRTGAYPASLDNDDFLRDYGTHLGDGHSTLRATALLCELQNRSPVAGRSALAPAEMVSPVSMTRGQSISLLCSQ